MDELEIMGEIEEIQKALQFEELGAVEGLVLRVLTWLGLKLLHIFVYIVDVISIPLALLALYIGCCFIIVGNRKKGFSVISKTILVYIVIQIVFTLIPQV